MQTKLIGWLEKWFPFFFRGACNCADQAICSPLYSCIYFLFTMSIPLFEPCNHYGTPLKPNRKKEGLCLAYKSQGWRYNADYLILHFTMSRTVFLGFLEKSIVASRCSHEWITLTWHYVSVGHYPSNPTAWLVHSPMVIHIGARYFAAF